MLRVSDTGLKVFYVCKRVNQKMRRFKIGPYPILSLHDAREKARQDKPAHGKGGPMFKHMDKNSDGQITKQESDDAALSMFDAMDQNKDGYVTQEEAKVSFHKHRKHGQAAAKSGTPAAPKK